MSKRFSVTGEQMTSESGQFTLTEEMTETGMSTRIRLTDNNSGQHMMFKLESFFDLVDLADDFADEMEDDDE
jgi:hypothetical protein